MDDFCITPRCRLCRFNFIEDDNIVILRPDGRVVTLPFGTVEDNTCTYKPCSPGCRHWDGNLTGYHTNCLQLGGYKLTTTTPKLSDVTSYTYDPWPGEDTRRFHWMRSRFASIIYSSLSLRLPIEVCDMIAQYCICGYASHISNKFCHENISHNFGINLSKPVWARYASFDGLVYIVSLTNYPTWDDVEPILLPDTPVHTVYVAEDHLGVREVHFNKVRHHPAPGLWWRTIRMHTPQLHGRTDGSKLRRLVCPGHKSDDDVLWAAPQLCPERLRLIKLTASTAPFKMALLKLDSEVIGYTFCWNNRIIALKPHSYKEDLSYYKYIAADYPHALWSYVPLRSYERIIEIWQRRRKYGKEIAFIAITNQDRILVIGAHPKPCWPPCSYELLYKAKPDEGPFYIDESPAGICAVASWPSTGRTVTRRLPAALSPYPHSMSYEDYLYTTASVENVSHVRPCRVESIITGLVFDYADGHRECVGQIRLDCLEAPTMIDVSQKMWLKVSLSPRGFPQVVDVGFSPKSKSDEYICIVWRGSLEWWVSLNQCQLYHDGQASLSTRL
ncbi:hypothetical protein GGS24DRAFT_471244 [Hypoxylon argillaceum]|nr:hypothetical protein GGS24DRAFT_471244 [Hypoxylon argillaceum]